MWARRYDCGCETGNTVATLCDEAQRLRDAANAAFTLACREGTWCRYDDAYRAYLAHYDHQPYTEIRITFTPAVGVA